MFRLNGMFEMHNTPHIILKNTMNTILVTDSPTRVIGQTDIPGAVLVSLYI